MTGTSVGTIMQLVGSVIGTLGGFLMASSLLHMIRPVATPLYLLSALRRGTHARGATRIKPATVEERLTSLQGLAFVTLGFSLQFTGSVLAWWYGSAQIF